MLNTESGPEESLRATPEARLWISVLLQAAKHLRDSTEWLSENFKSEASALPDYTCASHRVHISLPHDQVQMHIRRVRGAEEFFLGQDSTFGEICQILGYDEAGFRAMVKVWLQDHTDAIRNAQAFVRRPGFRDQGMRREGAKKLSAQLDCQLESSGSFPGES